MNEPSRDWMRNHWVALAMAAALLVTFLIAVNDPQGQRLADTRQQIAERRAKVAEDAARARQVPRMRKQVAELRRQLKGFDRRLPRQREMGGFLKEISAALQSGGLTEPAIQPGSPTSGDLYNRLPILMRFESGFMDLVEFLDRLDGMTRLTRVERIHIQPSTDDGHRVKVDMQVNIYFTES